MGGCKERIDQLLSRLGHGSRREVQGWARQGRITVDGVAERDLSRRVDAATVQLDGESLEAPGGLFLRFNKPMGCVCSRTDTEGASVYDYLPARWRQRRPVLTTVGRLDKDTTGVLLFTDVGWLVQRLTSPRSHWPKTYEVALDQEPPEESMALFASGRFQLEDEAKPCLPAQLSRVSERFYRLVLHEGRFHQVKRMFAAVGCTVQTLHRSQFGPYTVEDLSPGCWQIEPVPTPETLWVAQPK